MIFAYKVCSGLSRSVDHGQGGQGFVNPPSAVEICSLDHLAFLQLNQKAPQVFFSDVQCHGGRATFSFDACQSVAVT